MLNAFKELVDTHGRLKSSVGDKIPSEFHDQFKHAVGMKGSFLEEIESSMSPKEGSKDLLLALKMAEVKYQKEIELEELERQMFELNLKKKNAIVNWRSSNMKRNWVARVVQQAARLKG